MIKVKSIVLILFIIFIPISTFAFEITTHRLINTMIVNGTGNGFSLDAYLKSTLGLTNGIKELVTKNNNIQRWIELGGEYEDTPPWIPPYVRSINHFHDPLTEAGFTGIWGSGVLFGQSSIRWALAPQHTQVPGGFYSWSDVRNYYYRAITMPEKTLRDQNYADAFRGLGQLMHLVQDASVPAHSRDDGHYIFSEYEAWVADSGNQLISGYAPISFSGPTSDIASLIDSNQYHNPSPDPNLTTSTAVGLTEYSNANFFSDGTILNGTFPYPAWSSLEEYDEEILQGKKRTYLRKTGDGEHIAHAATARWFYKNLPTEYKYLGLKLDSTVYSDYAALLIPRAVGYSAGLLNYFFRGKLDAKFEGTNGIYITNSSSEPMNGLFALYYDATDGLRKPVTTQAPWMLALNAGDTSTLQTFTTPADVKYPATYALVFQGLMGAEQGAVVGRVMHAEANHLFIIQESAELLDPPVVQINAFGGDDKYWSWFYILGSGPDTSDTPRQRISGHFSLHGTAYIEKVTAAWMNGPAKLYLDGVLVDPTTWIGGPTTNPKTWALEPNPTDATPTDDQRTTLWIQLSDGKVFQASLISFRHIRFITERGCFDCQDDQLRKYSVIAEGQLDFRGAGNVASDPQEIPIFTIKSIGGHPVDQEKLLAHTGPGQLGHYCDPPTPDPPYNQFYEYNYSVPSSQYCIGIYDTVNFDTTQGQGLTVIRQSGFLPSDPGIDYFNPSQDMPIIAEAHYQTPANEEEQLRAIGLEPVNFIVTLH
jgi:hypothetical protein